MRHEGHIYKDIIFQRPIPEQIRHLGLLPADLHFHTNHSDSPTRVKDALKVAARKGIGLATTTRSAASLRRTASAPMSRSSPASR
jgi:hypothetical protein